MDAPFVHSAAWAGAQTTVTRNGLGKLLMQYWLGLRGVFGVGVEGDPVKNTPPYP